MRLTTVLTLVALFAAAGDASAQRPGGGRGRGFGGGMFGMGGAGLLTNEAIQKELKITEGQQKQISSASTEMREKARKAFTEMRESGSLDRDKMMKMFTKMRDDAKKRMDGILKPEQAKRLEQISLQQSMRNGVGLLGYERNETLKKALMLDDGQVSKLKKLNEDFRADMRDLGRDRGKIRELMEEIGADAMDILTSSQKAKLKEMMGKPFKMPERSRRRRKDF